MIEHKTETFIEHYMGFFYKKKNPNHMENMASGIVRQQGVLANKRMIM